jgi:hypothetical protein
MPLDQYNMLQFPDIAGPQTVKMNDRLSIETWKLVEGDTAMYSGRRAYARVSFLSGQRIIPRGVLRHNFPRAGKTYFPAERHFQWGTFSKLWKHSLVAIQCFRKIYFIIRITVNTQ